MTASTLHGRRQFFVNACQPLSVTGQLDYTAVWSISGASRRLLSVETWVGGPGTRYRSSVTWKLPDRAAVGQVPHGVSHSILYGWPSALAISNLYYGTEGL